MGTSHCVYVNEGRSSWTVRVGAEERAVFTGTRSRDRAIAYAFRLAEELRSSGPVLVRVDPDESAGARDVAKSRLAS